MDRRDGLSRSDVKQSTSETAAVQPKRLSTGEYRQVLSQQYERMAQHQQIIEAEYKANNIH